MAAEETGADQTVADPEEYNQTERLRSINQARQRVENTLEQSMAQVATDDRFGEVERMQVIRASLYSYLTNIEWLMVESEEHKMLTEQQLGEVVIDPPERFRRLANSDNRDYPRIIASGDLEPYTHPINGIQGYLSAPEVFSETWTMQVEPRHDQPQTMSQTKQTYMPVHVSKNAFRTANSFLSKAGIDVDLQEEQHRAVVDNDVLEEVEKWRKQNLD